MAMARFQWKPALAGVRGYCSTAALRRPLGTEGARELMERVKTRLGLGEKASEWKKVTAEDVKHAGGGTLLLQHDNSVYRLLAAAYPEKQYRAEAVRTKVPKRYWKDVQVRRAFMAEVAKQLGIEKPEDWLKVSRKKFVELGGEGVLKEHNKSLRLAVAELVDGAAPYAPKERVEYATAREFFRAAAQTFGVTKTEDWRRVRNADIVALPGGSRFLRAHGNSMLLALQAAFPEQDISLHCMRRVPRGHWEELRNQREAVDEVAARHGIKEPRDWRKLKYRDMVREGLSVVLNKYGNSVFRMLQAVYPEKDLQEHECREHVMRHYWDSAENRAKFLTRLKAAHTIESTSDWQKITVHDIARAGGQGLLQRYGGVGGLIQDCANVDVSLFELRQAIPGSFWETDENVIAAVKSIGKALQVRGPRDWLRISKEQVAAHKGQGLLRNVGLPQALEITYPEYRVLWQEMRAPDFKARRAVQRSMAVAVGSIFSFKPREHAIEEHAQ